MRPAIAHALLTLVQAWVAAGRPPGAATLGSYESWAEVVGGVLTVAGVSGFLANIHDTQMSTDAEWRGFVEAWWAAQHAEVVDAGRLVPLAVGAMVPSVAGAEAANRALAVARAVRERIGQTYTLGDTTVSIAAAGQEPKTRRQLYRLIPVSSSDAVPF